MIAQGAHASIGFLTEYVRRVTEIWEVVEEAPLLSAAERSWINGAFVKVCVRADSELELLRIINEAEKAGLRVTPIVDAGRTEFNGVPTLTCCAIGPDWEDKINAVTGELKLL